MKLLSDDSTIVAISSGLKNAAIGVIRVSGSRAIEVVSSIFEPSNKRVNLQTSPSHRVYFGYLKNNGEIVDEVVVIVYKSPKSYTGEDIIEINCHGNIILMQKIVNILLDKGCRLAKPGEFTLRAVLNKKMDLTKAIAIRDIIESTTEQMLKLAINNLQGKFYQKIDTIKQRILYWLGWVEALIDFPEEDIPNINLQNLKQDIQLLLQQVNQIISNYELSKMYREGIDTVIIGKPNVGKSSLFNYLYGQERVIISEIPGTTRDIVSEYINLNGIILKLYDTAGFRKTGDIIEKIGIDKAKEIIKKSTLVFWVVEALSFDENDIEPLSSLDPLQHKLLILVNKIDTLEPDQDISNFINHLQTFVTNNLKNITFKIIPCSIKHNINLDKIHQEISRIIGIDNYQDNILIDSFQYEILKKISYLLTKTLEDFELFEEVIAINLRETLNCILELTGENLSELVIENMLSRFCIGK
ncbi:MAG: tRNA uridine-5-carboxymethylaminomethyl(34) synthesis GTPase MnmE [bacterium]